MAAPAACPLGEGRAGPPSALMLVNANQPRLMYADFANTAPRGVSSGNTVCPGKLGKKRSGQGFIRMRLRRSGYVLASLKTPVAARWANTLPSDWHLKGLFAAPEESRATLLVGSAGGTNKGGGGIRTRE